MADLLKILIVDDEPEARELIQFMLQEEEDLQVVGLAGNVDDAIKLFHDQHPDLVFLDIQMPDKDGFQFIKMVHEGSFETGVVFVTAFENYAIQAIRNSVFDYILKPIHQAELVDAIDRFRKRVVRKDGQDISSLIEVLKGNNTNKVKLNTRSGYILIQPLEVVYCKADGNYTHIQLASGIMEVTSQNLKSIEELLKSGPFFRVSRSYLVNLKYLARVERKPSICILEYPGQTFSIKIPAQKIKMLESTFF